MKRFLLLFAMLPLLFASCAKESPINIDKEESVYYVKYKAWTVGQYNYLGAVSFRNEKGEMVQVGGDGISRSSFEVIIGPVPCGFNCEIHAGTFSGYTRIECSKNNSPFAYKASGNSELTYTIDY